jgi:hypothetical protein
MVKLLKKIRGHPKSVKLEFFRNLLKQRVSLLKKRKIILGRIGPKTLPQTMFLRGFSEEEKREYLTFKRSLKKIKKNQTPPPLVISNVIKELGSKYVTNETIPDFKTLRKNMGFCGFENNAGFSDENLTISFKKFKNEKLKFLKKEQGRGEITFFDLKS